MASRRYIGQLHAWVGRISRITGFAILRSTHTVAAAVAAVAENVVAVAAAIAVESVTVEERIAAAVAAGIESMVVAG